MTLPVILRPTYVFLCPSVCAYMFSVFCTMHCSAKRCLAIACRLSVCLWRWCIRTTWVENLGN